MPCILPAQKNTQNGQGECVLGLVQGAFQTDTTVRTEKAVPIQVIQARCHRLCFFLLRASLQRNLGYKRVKG